MPSKLRLIMSAMRLERLSTSQVGEELRDIASQARLRPSEARERATPCFRVAFQTPMTFSVPHFLVAPAGKKIQRYGLLELCKFPATITFCTQQWVDDTGAYLWRRLRCTGAFLYWHNSHLVDGENSSEVISASDFDRPPSGPRFSLIWHRILAALVAPCHLEHNYFSFRWGRI